MLGNLREFTFGIESDLVTPTSSNYRLPSWPPPRDWPVVIDKDGQIISRWGDARWDLAPWCGAPKHISFGDGEVSHRRQSKPLDVENADLMRMIATWFIWGTQTYKAVSSIHSNFYLLKSIFALCSQNGISATRLMRFPNVFEQVPKVIAPGSYQAAITLLHRLYDARDVLGFIIFDQAGLKRVTEAAPDHDPIQTPYIPPRIWLYQVGRLYECLTDFLTHREQFESCFQFCLNVYIKKFGSLEKAFLPVLERKDKKNPFDPAFKNMEDYPGNFFEIAERFGVAKVLMKWICNYVNSPRTLSSYFSLITFAGLGYVCNFTLQRREELASIRCLVSCDHIPRRSWPLFRAKAMLGDLIAGFSSPGNQSHQEQLAA